MKFKLLNKSTNIQDQGIKINKIKMYKNKTKIQDNYKTMVLNYIYDML